MKKILKDSNTNSSHNEQNDEEMQTFFKKKRNVTSNATYNDETDQKTMKKSKFKKSENHKSGSGSGRTSFKSSSNNNYSKGSSGYNNSSYGNNSGYNSNNQNNYKTNTIQKQRREIDEPTKNLRRLYNNLMQKETTKSRRNKTVENKESIVKKIIKIIDNSYAEYCYKHDTCRILQGCVKFGSASQRLDLINNLKPFVLNLIMKKYSIYLAVKIMKFATQTQTEEILNEQIFPNFNKLLKNSNGQVFMNFIFKHSSNKVQGALETYYFTKYLKFSYDFLEKHLTKEETVHLDTDAVVMEMQSTFTEDNIVATIKQHIEKQLEKTVHKTYIFQSVFNKVFDLFDPKLQVYFSEVFDDDLNDFLIYKKGVELACKVFTVAQAKTRKKILKNFKKVNDDPENPVEIDLVPILFESETTGLFLIKVINFIDDTKLLGKYVLKPLIPLLKDQLLTNKVAPKVIKNILQPMHCKTNTPYEQQVLSYNKNSSSKKDMDKRQEEIWSMIGQELHEILVNEDVLYKLLVDSNLGNLTLDLLGFYMTSGKKLGNNYLGSLLNSINYLLENDYNQLKVDVNNCILSDKVGHYNINRIIKKVIEECQDEVLKTTFIENIAKILLKDLKAFLDTKAIFIIVKIAENNTVNNSILTELKKNKKMITSKSEESGLIGYQHLAKLV